MIGFPLLERVLLDDEMAFVAHPLEPVVLDADRLVLLGVDIDFLRAFLVLEAKLVEVGCAAAFR